MKEVEKLVELLKEKNVDFKVFNLLGSMGIPGSKSIGKFPHFEGVSDEGDYVPLNTPVIPGDSPVIDKGVTWIMIFERSFKERGRYVAIYVPKKDVVRLGLREVYPWFKSLIKGIS